MTEFTVALVDVIRRTSFLRTLETGESIEADRRSIRRLLRVVAHERSLGRSDDVIRRAMKSAAEAEVKSRGAGELKTETEIAQAMRAVDAVLALTKVATVG